MHRLPRDGGTDLTRRCRAAARRAGEEAARTSFLSAPPRPERRDERGLYPPQNEHGPAGREYDRGPLLRLDGVRRLRGRLGAAADEEHPLEPLRQPPVGVAEEAHDRG